MSEPKPLVIGVNVNENTMRDPNPSVPWTPAEIAAVAAESERAGATLMHYHGRTPNGGADHSAATYAEIARRVHEVSSILLAPSMANVPGHDVDARLGNLVPNQADPDTAVDLLPIDMGCANMDLFDPEAGDYTSDGRVFVNDVRAQSEFLEHARTLRLAPYVASFNLSWTRAIAAHHAAGRVPEPFAAVLVLGGPEFVAAHPTTTLGYRSHLEVLPREARYEWLVSSYRGDVLDVAADVITDGGHVVIGVGDHAHTGIGSPSTPELVAHVAALGRSLGRRPATPDEARELLGVSAHAGRR